VRIHRVARALDGALSELEPNAATAKRSHDAGPRSPRASRPGPALGLCLGDGNSTQQASEESVLVSYDLRSVMPRWDESTSWSQGLLVSPAASPHQDLPSASATYADLASFDLLDLMSQILGDELRREGRELVVEGSSLTVLAPEPVQEQVRAVLDARCARRWPARSRCALDVLSRARGTPELAPSARSATTRRPSWTRFADARGAQHRSYQLEPPAGHRLARRAPAHPVLFDLRRRDRPGGAGLRPGPCRRPSDGMRLGMRGVPVAGGLVLERRAPALGPRGQDAERKIAVRPRTTSSRSSHLHRRAGDDPDARGAGARPGLRHTLIPDGKRLALTLEAELERSNRARSCSAGAWAGA
jgi:hypothetical protein